MTYNLTELDTAVTGVLCLNCGEVVVSWGHHDYKHCRCGKIMVDGGREYLRFGWEPESKYQVVTVSPTKKDTNELS